MKTSFPESVAVGVLFSTRYWNQADMTDIFMEVQSSLSDYIKEYQKINFEFYLIKDHESFEKFYYRTKNNPVVLIPMSGGIQPWMLKVGQSAAFTVIVQGYYNSFFSERVTSCLVEKNAPPALTDTYAVLKRTGMQVMLALSIPQIFNNLKAYLTMIQLRGMSILFAGEPEPWVISSVRTGKEIEERFGIKTLGITLDELQSRFYKADPQKVSKIADEWLLKAEETIEPNKDDIYKASALQQSIFDLMDDYQADCFCAKCFELIGKIDTTACLALSFLNSSDAYCGACEGDLDSAVSLIIMKKLTGMSPWMANPIVLEQDKLTLAHCSAPFENGYDRLTLRSHHESKKGVSPQVELPVDRTVTIMRIGNHMNNIQFFTGKALRNPDINTCRTRLQIQVDDLQSYMEKTLGCHYTMVYGDHTELLKIFSKLARLTII